MSVFIKGRDLLGLSELDDAEVEGLLDFAAELKQRARCGEAPELLRGVQLFLYDPDRVLPAWDPFRLAMSQLGGSAQEIGAERIRLSWSETFLDLFAQLDGVGHGLALASLRPGEGQQFIADAAALMRRPVFNALSEREAPCQALAALLAVDERRGEPCREGRAAITWAPPSISPKPVSLPLSLAELLLRRGLDLHLACPLEFQPDGERLALLDTIQPGAFEVSDDAVGAIEGADLVFSLNWTEPGEGLDPAAVDEAAKSHAGWRLGRDRFGLAAQGALLGGGLPQSRERELEPELLELPNAIHLEESENLLHVVKALLALTLDIADEQRGHDDSIQ